MALDPVETPPVSRPEPEPPPEPPPPIPATHHTALLTDLTPVCVYQPTLPIDVGGLPYCHSRRHPLSTTAHNARLGVGQRPVAGSAAADMGHAAAGDKLVQLRLVGCSPYVDNVDADSRVAPLTEA